MDPSIVSLNPFNAQVLGQFAAHTDAEVERRLQRAGDAFGEYRRRPFAERAILVNRAAQILESEKDGLARMITMEMGKVRRAAVQEVEKCALGCRYYADNAERFLADETFIKDKTHGFVRHQPLGLILAVMPWNFPFWQVFRFAAPTLMAGNVALLKHASNVPQCALAIEDIFRRAGFPEGVFQSVLVGSGRIGMLIDDPRVKAVTLTGSVGAGRSVAAATGKQIKKTVLELGGSDPFIVMPSANVERAAAVAVQARTINNGQSCIAAKRFIVHDRIAREFERGFVERMAALKVGDPMDDRTDVGPLATAEVRTSLESQVNNTVQMGARVLLGGKCVEGPGFFYEPTVLTDIPASSPACHEELFGPVASLFRVNGIEAAIRLANDTAFGLGSCLWTEDKREQELFVDEIEAGAAFVNGLVASDPRLPFGGIKQSGYGRELSRDGIREFVNIKTVSVAETDAKRSQAE
jgi:succinate-semialdehyde dehydrogenase/glutarate-semialdehyde dehydrogenase